jgi:hypothetical protein
VALRDQDHFCPPLPLTMSPEMEACWGEGPLSGKVLRHKVCSCFSEDFLDGIENIVSVKVKSPVLKMEFLST